MYKGEKADWIWKLFGLVNGVGRRMGVLDGDGNRRKGRVSFGVNLGRPVCKDSLRDLNLVPVI